MKIAFTVTAPDLARALTEIMRQAKAERSERPSGRRSTVSDEARRALTASMEESDDDRS